MKLALTTFALLIAFFAGPSFAENIARVSGAEFDRSDRYLMPSERVGDDFRIDVLLPIDYTSSENKYAVVYVTDGNFMLASAAASRLAQATNEFPKLILVGIGWNVPSVTRIRVRDLTPSCDSNYQKRASLTDDECGKANAFASFIGEELKPFIDKTYRTTGDNTLVGYSFGGLFAIHVLFEHSDLFDRYVIGSASMNWDDGYVFRAEQKYSKMHTNLAKTVYLSAGGLEGNKTIPNAYFMYEKLLSRNYPELKIAVEVLRDESHMTSISPAVMRGLRSVLVDQAK